MSGDMKHLVFNTRERAVSNDVNRLQSFQAQMIEEWLRLTLDSTSSELNANGDLTEHTTQGNPLRGIVMNGLQLGVINATVNLTISNGVVCVLDPPVVPSGDISNYRFIQDAGLLSGVLTLTPNGGATRIDILEVSRTSFVAETDSRDIFNPVTGTFAPALVNKVEQGRLTYRIRLGAPGGGFPGVALGWLPLYVIKVPNATTTWDTCAIWDVRPLLSDLRAPGVSAYEHQPERTRTLLWSFGATKLRGIVDITHQYWRAGGQLGFEDDGFLDITDASVAIADPSFSLIPNSTWNLWAVFPFTLPRWVRYTKTGVRKPSWQRGIPVLSNTGPFDVSGVPSFAFPVGLPVETGMAPATSSAAVLLVAGWISGTGIQDVQSSGDIIYNNNAHAVTPSIADNEQATFVLTDAITHPANARALLLRFTGTFSLSGSVTDPFEVTRKITCYMPDGTSLNVIVYGPNTTFVNPDGSPQDILDQFTVRIPLMPLQFGPPSLGNPFTVPYQRKVQWRYFTGTPPMVASLQKVFVVGWDLGP